jgi:esterase/lipase superfamily enzyme
MKHRSTLPGHDDLQGLSRWRRVVRGIAVTASLALAGCATGHQLLQSGPRTYDILYLTNRAKAADANRSIYLSERSRTLSFGSASVALHADDGDVASVTETGQFPAAPYPLQPIPGGFRRTALVISEHKKAVSAFQAELAVRLERSSRKDVLVFVHGYNNTFHDALSSTAKLCDSLRREFVCVALTWPAGGSRGVFFGYTQDRESGEASVSDVRRALRAIAGAPGLRNMHLVAHSLGANVLSSALAELAVESYVAGSTLQRHLKIKNVVLCAPDIDFDVAANRLTTVLSDPDMPVGKRPVYSAAIPAKDTHLTIYSSPADKALNISRWLSGSPFRLGQLASEERLF